MPVYNGYTSFSWRVFTVVFLVISIFFSKVSAINWVKYTGNDGTVWLDDSRQPALYTQDFGDCQGDSLINVTRFDAAYYQDNMTVLFHLGGNSPLVNEALMFYIGVWAYGENRFSLTFNPCNANILSLCPLNSSVPIEASGIIPVAPSDVAGIPSIALTIPDFEGQAILRIFANSTQSQIACFSAVLTNGNSFNQPKAVGSILGVFTVVALVSSIVVAMYGQSVPETRKHYAHSVSIFVVFSVFHHIYFTGALSMNWPSVLVAFWNNYAWSAGMIYSQKMQNSINQFIGSNRGNISMVGAAPAGEDNVGLGGGYQISQIYKRATDIPFVTHEGTGTTFRPNQFEHTLASRDLVNSSTGFSWYGHPVLPGVPLPGNYSGFAGTLGQSSIPASNAFMTGLLWFLSLLACVATLMILLKIFVEALIRIRVIKTSRLNFYRDHWLGFTTAAILRTFFIAFFMMIFLSLFQFTLGGAKGVLAVAAIVFVIFFVGLMSIAAYALYYKLRGEKFVSGPDRLVVTHRKAGPFPWFGTRLQSEPAEKSSIGRPITTLPWWRAHFSDVDSAQPHVHDDEFYTTKFGWLVSRFRRSKWWFFSFWLVYEFGRACFYGGAAGHALTQVFGLLAWEIIALIAIVSMKPFESNRLNLLMVYLLGFSKVVTVALSSAFDARFNLDRIMTTVIGFIIIIIQGILTVCLMIAIVLGAISSYMSIRRNHEEFKPRSWIKHRTRYFKHMDQKATDQPPPPPPPPPPMPEIPKDPYFAVSSVRRELKIEDEDVDNQVLQGPRSGKTSMDLDGELKAQQLHSRSHSLRSRTSTSQLPYGARRHRESWSTKDFQEMYPEQEQIPSGMASRMSIESMRETAGRHRSASLRINTRGGGYNGNGTTGPDGSGSPVQKMGHSRSISSPHAARNWRQSVTVDEEKEQDTQPKHPARPQSSKEYE